jgi:hypothetical protein
MNCQIALWKQIRQPFYIPQSIHRCQLKNWESIDCDVAGCLLCGKIHICRDDENCPLIINEGRHVCEITGFYTRRNVFVDDEFVDTVASIGIWQGKNFQKISPCFVEFWVNQILGSPQAHSCIKTEISKRNLKLKQCFIKHAKIIKSRKQSLCILHLCTLVAFSMSQIRKPKCMTKTQQSYLISVCVSHINFFCGLFFEHFEVVVPTSKTAGFVVGFLYLMRQGLILFGNIVIVPCVPELKYVLPSESQIKTVFCLSTKIMTEVENCIKVCMRNVDKNKLLDIGFKII